MVKPPPSTSSFSTVHHQFFTFRPGIGDQHGGLCPAALRGSPLWSRAFGAMYHRQLQSRGGPPCCCWWLLFFCDKMLAVSELGVRKMWVSGCERFFLGEYLRVRRFSSVPSLQPKTGSERGAPHGISWTIRENLGHWRRVALRPFSIAVSP